MLQAARMRKRDQVPLHYELEEALPGAVPVGRVAVWCVMVYQGASR